MEDQKDPKSMPACSHAEGAGRATDQEGIWSDPEAILRPTEGERLKAIICEFEDERYPQMMALGWTKLALERLPQNQIALKKLLESSLIELAHFVVAYDMATHEAHRMLSECTGEPSQYPGPPAMVAIEEYQRSELSKISDDEIESAEHAYRNTMRLEWYVEKKAAEWLVETLKMVPLDRELARLREILVPTRKALLRRMAEIEEAIGFDMVLASES
jgi:hypothetical protein